MYADMPGESGDAITYEVDIDATVASARSAGDGSYLDVAEAPTGLDSDDDIDL